MPYLSEEKRQEEALRRLDEEIKKVFIQELLNHGYRRGEAELMWDLKKRSEP